MLFYQAIDTATLELLINLQQRAPFKELRLVGGTSLALQYGHRKSIDIDLFGNLIADDITIAKELNSIGKTFILKKTPHILIYSVNDIKVDLVNYPYPWIGDLIEVDGLSLANDEDIAAMKLSAITGRGSKKDFIDLHFLLEKFSLSELLKFYSRKFHDGSEFLVLKSLIYFEDAEQDPPPSMLISVSWNDVKIKIVQEHRKYLRTL
ncbi:MAG: nucleotidyl transferase AbiEii/AbiGii toxin family protein [Bacteroidota bacterium]|nr:nucleotidyl transferase AbiEii/AbiGii toxin family protein [Bacteroidota bacterium]